MELRTMPANCRLAGDTSREFVGDAAVFNTEAPIGDPFRWGFFEQVAPTAFNDSIASDDIVFLSDHDPGKPHARMSAGTLQLTARSDALGVVCPDIPATSYGNDLVINLRNGNVKGMSFGFNVLEDSWSTKAVDLPGGGTAQVDLRTLLRCQLAEVSTTAFPAYPTTSAGVRAALRMKPGQTGIDTTRGYVDACALRDRIIGEWAARDGQTISAATQAQLQEILDLIAAADDAVDNAQPLLAGLMGVPNPDATDGGESDDEGEEGDTDPNASQESARARVLMDRRLSALAAYTGIAGQ